MAESGESFACPQASEMTEGMEPALEKAKSFARLIELKHEHMARAGTRGCAAAPSHPLLSPHPSNAADRRNQSCLSSRLTLCLSPCWPSQEAPPPFWRSVTSCLSPHALARRF